MDLELSPELTERVLARLGLTGKPETTLEGLRTLYGAWCQRVPFDNVRKLIHVRGNKPGPLPGSQPAEYFGAWLKFGTGGTCWSGAGALHTLLKKLGFNSVRGVATMLAAPDIPPNHGTVLVKFGSARYLVDSSILHGEPLLLVENSDTSVSHPAWGVRSYRKDRRWYVSWRALHKVDGFECRFERFGASVEEFGSFYAKTSGWSPFNFEVTARANRGDEVVGVSFGHFVKLHRNGSVTRQPVSQSERNRVLIEEVGLSEEIVSQLPPDIPTPPPPGSQTAQLQAVAASQ